MTVQRARERVQESWSRRERLRELLLPTRPMVTRSRKVNRGGWREETYGPIPGTGTFRDPRFYDRRARRYR